MKLCDHITMKIAFKQFMQGFSPRTVEVHRANLMSRLEVTSMAAVRQPAMSAGFQ